MRNKGGKLFCHLFLRKRQRPILRTNYNNNVYLFYESKRETPDLIIGLAHTQPQHLGNWRKWVAESLKSKHSEFENILFSRVISKTVGIQSETLLQNTPIDTIKGCSFEFAWNMLETEVWEVFSCCSRGAQRVKMVWGGASDSCPCKVK